MTDTMELIDALIQASIGALHDEGIAERSVALRKQLAHRIEMLEIRSASAPIGTVRNVVVGPAGAVYAMEMLAVAEKNRKNPNYVPPWNPGKEVNGASKKAKGDIETFLRNPLFTEEQREEIRKLYG